MKMFNASLEDFIDQCDSKVFKFTAYQSTEVDDHLAHHLYARLKDRGVFIVEPSMSPAKLKKAAREAQIAYLDGSLRTRIRNYLSQADEFKKMGVTLPEEAKLTEAIRWDKELRGKLSIEAPLRETKSFDDFDIAKALDLKIDQEMFSPEKVKRGRPAKKVTSFEDADIAAALKD